MCCMSCFFIVFPAHNLWLHSRLLSQRAELELNPKTDPGLSTDGVRATIPSRNSCEAAGQESLF